MTRDRYGRATKENKGANLAVRPFVIVLLSYFFNAACAAANRAIGTRYGLQLT